MRLLAAGLALALTSVGVSACAGVGSTDGSAADGSVVAVGATTADREITLTRWDGTRQWRRGTAGGTTVVAGRLTFDSPVARATAGGRSYDVARWTSPWVAPGYDYTELVASWSALTPKDSWIQIQVRGRSGAKRTTWDTIGRWAAGDQHLQRSTMSGQSDDGTSVAVDTWRTPGLNWSVCGGLVLLLTTSISELKPAEPDASRPLRQAGVR